MFCSFCCQLYLNFCYWLFWVELTSKFFLFYSTRYKSGGQIAIIKKIARRRKTRFYEGGITVQKSTFQELLNRNRKLKKKTVNLNFIAQVLLDLETTQMASEFVTVATLFLGYLAYYYYAGNGEARVRPPHLIFMLADDLGWNDVGYHNPSIYSPNLDFLAQNGIRLNQSYMQQMCSPSRSAIMTGYYPYRTGLQHGVIWRISSIGMPLQFTLLPEKLRLLGYETHMVGKWHLGHCNWNYTPTFRGFNSFMGSHAGTIAYFNQSLPGSYTALDYFNNTEPLLDYKGIHNSIPFVQQVEHILSRHDHSKPLFLYLPFHLVHFPLEVPPKIWDAYSNMEDSNRKTYSEMVSTMDDDIGQIVQLLKKYGIYKDSIIFFNSDNGGHVYHGASNLPLRGIKNTLYEGGTRVVGFVHSPILKASGYVYNGLIHAVDWFATLLKLAGGQPDADIDGMDVWDSLIHNLPSPRREFVYGYDNYDKNLSGGIRVGDWKLIVGKAGLPDDWPTPENLDMTFDAYKSGDTLLEWPDAPPFRLFNVIEDPCEHNNLANEMPEKVHELLQRLREYGSKSVVPLWQPNDPIAVARLGTILTPGWCEPILQNFV